VGTSSTQNLGALREQTERECLEAIRSLIAKAGRGEAGAENIPHLAASLSSLRGGAIQLPLPLTPVSAPVAVETSVPVSPPPLCRHETRCKHERCGDRWSPEDEEELLTLLRNGISTHTAAERIGRTRGAVESRVTRMAIRGKWF
jgi:hypothetical protein